MYKNLGKFHHGVSNTRWAKSRYTVYSIWYTYFWSILYIQTYFENSGESHMSQTEAHNIATC